MCPFSNTCQSSQVAILYAVATLRNQPELYVTTAVLQLKVFQLGKLLCHNEALLRPLVRQTLPAEVLHLVTAGLGVDPQSWAAACQDRLPFMAAFACVPKQ